MAQGEKGKSHFKAVYNEDLTTFLQSLGVLESLKNGKIKCNFCGDDISLVNLQAVAPFEGRLTFICNNKSCIEKIGND